MWMLYVLLYGILKGIREVCKKKSMEKSSMLEVLFFYTLISFLLVTPDYKNAMGVPSNLMIWIAIKSGFVFSAWILSFTAIKKLPLSLYGVLDLSRVLFATLLAVIFLHETLGAANVIGLVLVCAGLLLLKKPGTSINEKAPFLMVVFALLSCIFNACSGLLDKILMTRLDNATQLQFWYMFFMVAYYLVYLVATRTKLNVISSLKNPWIYLLAILFVIADRALFVANSDPASQISIMTLIKQSGTIVTILAGRIIYKEKNIRHKLVCAGIIILGIVISVF